MSEVERSRPHRQGDAHVDRLPPLGCRRRVKAESEREVVARDGAFTAGLCERAVDVLFKAGGGGALFDDHPLQRAFRDVHAATAHISMIWEPQATTFGRVALGLPCDNPTL